MKKFFYIVLILFSFTSAFAQTPPTIEQAKAFAAQRFLTYMPDYVLANRKDTVITEQYVADHPGLYQYIDLQGKISKGYIRVGDTLVSFKNEPFYSRGENQFIMGSVPEEPKISKRAIRKAEKQARKEATVQRSQRVPARIGSMTTDGYGTSVIF